MAWYRSGTVTSVAGTNVITGTGTLWNNPIFGIAAGQMIFVPGTGQVVIYEILAVDSDTKIRVTKNIASAITNSEYAIVTTVSNSMSDLARRTTVQLALYQKLLEDWQDITTGTGDVTIIAPDGTEVVIPALSWISGSKAWFDANKDLIENAGEAVAGAETARDQAVAANTAAQEARESASDSATTAINAAGSITGSVALAQAAAATATSEAVAASADADRAEAAADSIDMDVLNAAIDGKMSKSGGTFTGLVALSGNATAPLHPITKQQFDILNTDAFTASQVVNTPWTNLTLQNGWVTATGYRSVCRKINGMVYIDIHIINGTFTNWTTVTTLPAGHRPLTTMVLSSLATFSLPNLPKIYIQPTGEVQLLDVTGSSNILHLTYIITLQ
ncbi:hypothetical protein NUF81_004605 [Yersinia enterocolitica]|nr:hypothetical protein [Yersinia enterocolitica]